MKPNASILRRAAAGLCLILLFVPSAVHAANKAPTVSLTAPAQNSSFVGTPVIAITATAADADGVVARVEFLINGALAGTDTTAPYSYSWSGMAPGFYTLTARAVDALGATATSAARTVQVNTLLPTADAYVQDGNNATKNFGTTTPMQVMYGTSAGSKRNALLKFDVAAIPQVGRAILRINAKLSGSGSLTSTLYPVSNTTWIESGTGSITWNNQPATGTPALGTLLVNSTTYGWKEIDVSSYVRAERSAGRSIVSFKISNSAASGSVYVQINARESGASTAPELLVTPNQPPVVSLVAPTHGTIFPSTQSAVILAATASDPDGGISAVEFFEGAVKRGDGTYNSALARWEFSWSGGPAGSHSLFARATDNLGAVVNSAAINFSINAKPIVSIDAAAPSPGTVSTVPAVLNVNATASDPDVGDGIHRVELIESGIVRATDTTAPYSFVWNNALTGNRCVVVRAWDNRGEFTDSTPARCFFINLAPTVSLIQPTAGTIVTTPVTVPLTASALDSGGNVSKVEFLINGMVQFTDTAAPWTANWANPAPGTYLVQARATDNHGAVVDSATAQVQVKDDDTDYDGRSNWNELQDGTNPSDPDSVRLVRLSHFTFNNPGPWVEPPADPLTEPVGHAPLYPAPAVAGAPSWSGTAADIAQHSAGLIYRDIEQNATGAWYPNINLRKGAVRFWFRPNWDGEWLKAYSGIVAHYSPHGAQTHRHYFSGATAPLVASANETLFTYVYLDPADPPQSVMLEFHEAGGTWEHRAYWGPDLIGQQTGWGLDGTASRRNLGARPSLGQWVRLEISPADVGLAGKNIDGMSYVLYGGRAKWDKSGKKYHDNSCRDFDFEEAWFDDGFPPNVTLSTAAEGETWSFGLSWPRLLEVGRYADDASYGMWQIGMAPDGSILSFTVHDAGQYETLLSAPIRFRAGEWHQVALNYTPEKTELYVDGEIVTSGLGVNLFPPATVRDDGIEIGSNESGAICDGGIEELECFNHTLTRAEIVAGFPNFDVPNQTADADYDGRSDLQETYLDVTNPNDPASVRPVRLGYWRFDDAAWTGEQGQVPLFAFGALSDLGVSGKTLQIYGPTHGLTYRDVEVNGSANIDCRQGSVRFWFRPTWQSGAGPSEARLIEVGGKWVMGVKAGGTQLAFWENRQGVSVPNIETSINWQYGRWHQIVLVYSVQNTRLYVDGVEVPESPGAEVNSFPTAAERAGNFRIGHGQISGLQAQGHFDELETFNYRLETARIQSDFGILQGANLDGDTSADYAQEPFGSPATPFARAPIVVTGVLQAEQYDRGGPGVSYHSGVDHDYFDYRNTRLLIDPCDDLGGGYCVNRLQSGDWMQYTFEVRLPGAYTLEARVNHVTPGVSDPSWFRYQFVDAAGQVLSQTPIVTIPPDQSWQNVALPDVQLAIGPHRVRILMGAASEDGYVCKLNYISVYPTVPVNTFPPRVADLASGQFGAFIEGENGAAFSVARQNSLTVQAAVNDILDHGGGTVQFPPGTYYLAQVDPGPYDYPPRNGVQNRAVAIYRWTGVAAGGNIRLTGSALGETILKAHNRSTTLFWAGDTCCGQPTNFEKITFERLTLKCRPHTRYSESDPMGVHEPGLFNNGIMYSGAGACIVIAGGTGAMPNQLLPTRHVNILDCKFVNSEATPVILYEVDGALLRGNQFLFHTADVPDGDQPGNPAVVDGVTFDLLGSPPNVGVFSGAGALVGLRNLVMVDNYFNGNVRDPSGAQKPADGILWNQSGGNFYVAGNELHNYGLEGIQWGAGPGCVVQNRFITPTHSSSTAALVAYGTCGKTLTGAGPGPDLTYTFAGNAVTGGRHAFFGNVAGISLHDPTYVLHFTDNDVDVDPPPLNTPWDEFPGTAILALQCSQANVSGNYLRRGGFGGWFAMKHFSSEFIKNDFSRADHMGLVFETEPASLDRVIIARTLLGSGRSHAPAFRIFRNPSLGHLRLRPEDAQRFFLLGCGFRDLNGQPNSLLLDPPGLPVNVQ